MPNTTEKIWSQIVEFEAHYPGHVPSPGFLAGLNKTSMETVRKHLTKLESEGKIVRVLANKKVTSYYIK